MSSSSGGRGNFPLTFQLQVQGDTEVTSKFSNVATSLERISPAAAKMQTGVSGASTALGNLGNSAQTSTGGINQFSGALTSFSGNTQNAIQRTEGFTGALSGFSQANTSVQGGLTQSNTLMGGLGDTTTQTGSKVQGVAETFRSNRGIIFALTGIAVAGQEAIGMFQSLQMQEETLNKAQAEVNRLQAEGKEGTKEYSDAQADLADAQRGYNFILKSTISSFTDMIPFALLLTSSFMDISLKAGGSKKILEKLGGVIPKITNAFRGLGTAIGGLGVAGALGALATPIGAVGLAIAGISAAVLALSTNFMGVRDAVNEAGVAFGNAVPRLKPVLDIIGQHGNALLDTIGNWLNFGQTVSAEGQTIKQEMEQLSATGQQMGKILPDQWAAVQEAVLSTKDATMLSINDQIELYNKLGDDAKDVTFSLGALLKQQQQDQEFHTAKYNDFVTAMKTGDQEIVQSMGLTKDEFTEFYKQWETDLKAFEESHNQSVDKLIANWDSFSDLQASASESLIGEINKIEQEMMDLAAQSWDLDSDDAIDEMSQKMTDLSFKLDEFQGKVSDTALSAAQDFVDLGNTAKEALEVIALEIQGGDFDAAITALETAIDNVPSKYQGNFSEINSIIDNSQLNSRQKIEEIINDFGSLEQAFVPLKAGALEYSRAQAELAASFDELAVAARAQKTDVADMETAWKTFLASLSPAQKDLPIIEDLIARVDAGTTSFGEAMAEVEAVGRKMSAALGETVMTSFTELEKTIVDMPNGTKKAFGLINGQVVDLGKVTDSELVSGGKSVVNSAKNMTTQTQTQFSTMGTNMKTLGDTVETETQSMGSALDAFTKSVQTAWDKTVNFFADLGKKASEAGVGIGEWWNSIWGGGSKTQNATLGFNPDFFEDDVPGGMTVQEIQALQQAWSTFSTSFATYYTSITTKITAMQQAFSTFSTSVATYATSMKNNLGIFFSFVGQAFPMLDNLLKAHQQTWSSFSTSIASYANSMKSNLGIFFQFTGQAFPMLDNLIKAHQQTWSSFSTSVSTYANSMRANIANFVNTARTGFTSLSSAITSLRANASNLSTSWRTYMSSMSSAVNSFANTARSAFRSVESAANSLVSALRRVESQARSAARAAAGVRSMQHGGAAIVAAQQGFSGIVSSPTTYKGVHMGEGFSPELVTVTPLTRGTGNHFGPTVGSGGGRGGPIVIEVHNILDGREIGRFVKKIALEDIGIQI